MSKKAKTTFVTLGIALGSALLGWLQVEYGDELGVCPPSVVILPAEAADGGTD